MRSAGDRVALLGSAGGVSRELVQELGVIWLAGDVTDGPRPALRVLRHEPAG